MNQKSKNISKRTWLFVSLIALLLTILLFVVFIIFSSRLSEFGITKSFYYILLIPAGLCSAAFLFGGMRSYARYTGENKFGKLELTGPVVVFFLVIVGGFVFAEPENSISLTIRVVVEKNEDIIINSGEIIIDLGLQRMKRKIDENGEVHFSDLNSKHVKSGIRIIPKIEGYLAVSTEPIVIPNNRIIYFPIEKKIFSTPVRGTVINKNGNSVSNVNLNFSSGISSCISDSLGNFNIELPFKVGQSIILIANLNNSTVYRDYITIPDSKSLIIKID